METGPYHSLITTLSIILLLFINGVFTAIHTGLISLNTSKLEEDSLNGDEKAGSVLKILSNQDRLNQSFEIANIIFSLLTIAYFAKRLREVSSDGYFWGGILSERWVTIVAIVVYTILCLLYTSDAADE